MSYLEAQDFPQAHILIGKGQPYNALPAKIGDRQSNGLVTTCWKVTPAQAKEIAEKGCLFYQQLTFWNGFHPVLFSTHNPLQPVEDIGVRLPFEDLNDSIAALLAEALADGLNLNFPSGQSMP